MRNDLGNFINSLLHCALKDTGWKLDLLNWWQLKRS